MGYFLIIRHMKGKYILIIQENFSVVSCVSQVKHVSVMRHCEGNIYI